MKSEGIKISTVIASDVNNSLESWGGELEQEMPIKVFLSSLFHVCKPTTRGQKIGKLALNWWWWWISHARHDVVAIDDWLSDYRENRKREGGESFFNSLTIHEAYKRHELLMQFFHHSSALSLVHHQFFLPPVHHSSLSLSLVLQSVEEEEWIKKREEFCSSLNCNYFYFEWHPLHFVQTLEDYRGFFKLPSLSHSETSVKWVIEIICMRKQAKWKGFKFLWIETAAAAAAVKGVCVKNEVKFKFL